MKTNKKLQRDLESRIKDFEEEFDGEIKISVYNIASGEGAGIRGNKKGWAASIIKVPVMASVIRRIERGELSFKDTIPTTRRFTLEPTDKISRLPEGTPVRIIDLIYEMIVSSDNEATNLLVNKIGIKKVNRDFKRMNTKRTMLGHLLCYNVPRYTSLFNLEGDNITNPNDMVNIMRQIYDDKFSALGEYTRKCCRFFMDQTGSYYLRGKELRGHKVKAKIGMISSQEDGDDLHEVGIIDDKTIVCVMLNKVDQKLLRSGDYEFKTMRDLEEIFYRVCENSGDLEESFDRRFGEFLFNKKPYVGEVFQSIRESIKKYAL